jgi:hypothetical protein
MHIWQLGFACISRGRGRGRIELDSYLLGFVYENIIRSSHSTDHVKRNRMSKKKQGHHSPNRVRTQKKRREVRCTERAVQQNSFWWQNLHDSLTHSQIGRQSRCCHEKFVGIRCIRLQSEVEVCGLDGSLDRQSRGRCVAEKQEYNPVTWAPTDKSTCSKKWWNSPT